MKINGDLSFHTLGDGEIKNAVIERIAGGAAGVTLPATNIAGRLAYNTTDNVYYFHNGTAWTAMATGGDASGLQTELNAVETASGGIFDQADGTYVAGVLNAATNITNSLDLADAILQLDAAITGTNELAELADTNITAPAAGNVLRYDGVDSWDNVVPTLSNMATDVTASSTEVNYLVGVTSAVQTQITANDGDIADLLTIVGAVDGDTTLTFTSTNYVGVNDSIETAISSLDSGIALAISSIKVNDLNDVVDGQTGAPVIGNSYWMVGNAGGTGYDLNASTLGTLNNVAAAVDSATTEDILAYDGTEWTAITPATFAAEISLGSLSDVADGNLAGVTTTTVTGTLYGIVGNVGGTGYDTAVVNLNSVSNVTDSGVQGNIVYADSSTTWATALPGTTSGVQAWNAGLDDVSGLTATDGNFIVGDGTNWVAESGAVVRTSLDVMSTADLASTYVDVAGDTMSGILNMGTNVISNIGTPAVAGDAANKGYVDGLITGLSWKDAVRLAADTNVDLVTGTLLTVDSIVVADGDRVLVMGQTVPAENGIYIAGTGAWTRATDMDDAAEFDGSAVFVMEGATYESNGFTQTETVVTVDTDVVSFVAFSGGSTITAGTGLAAAGNTFNVNMGAGISAFPSDEVGVDLYGYDAGTCALGFTTDGVARVATESVLATGDELFLFIDGTTLAQSGAGIKVAAQGITELELHTSIAGDGLTGGNGTALSVVVDNTTIEINTDTLRIKDLGVTNAKLTNSSIIVTGDSGTNATSLGGTLAIIGGTGITTAQVGGTVTITGDDATTTTKGVASFAAADFTVVAGAVSINSIGNAQLDNSSVTLAADAGVAEVVDLGATLTIAGGTLATTTVSATNTVTIDIAADTSDLGDVTGAATAAGEIIVATGVGAYAPAQIQYVNAIGVAATTWIVAHSLGQKFVNVTIYDSADQVIIPESITATDANTTTITFNTAITGTAVIMGVPGVAAV